MRNRITSVGTLLAGICVAGMIIGPYIDLGSGNQPHVLAKGEKQSSEKTPAVQIGLRGMVNGMKQFSNYSEESQLLHIATDDEDVLAGMVTIKRHVLPLTGVDTECSAAGELGYYTQKTVYENQMSYEEYETLLKIVEAEATGGDIRSKMLVAGVVLNRVRDERFPNTIREVVWETSQFQPTNDGRIHTVSVTEDTQEAVDRVLQGEDLSKGALFFLARDFSEEENIDWFDSSLVKIFEYGGHEYFTFKES